MSGPTEVLVIVAVVAFVVVRQFRTERLAMGRKWWLLPLILGFVAVRDGSLMDPRHTAASVVLLAVEVVVSIGIGIGWAFTTRIWADEEGDVWTRGTAATAGTWVGGIAARAAVVGVGLAMGVHLGSSSFMLGFALSLLARTGVLMWRAGHEQAAYVGAVPQPVGEVRR
ncbi:MULTISPECIES: DUF1453 domain-containing protein [unclassified Streptomyces]|uniref:DUF1453 domain-containing protein n=1 Tax=unclassified Streptomyces TaxID=2593676 RepID=UPI000DB9A20B|nr:MULTISPECIES: DUF1453 domain-containing protein [unclassified Streptomyces]MYT74159.1 DUF1453 domain-containing protein [Streptomyces sp. SID8367]RAJ89577.1 hypothetical protein K377_01703 [Streptomyces sp. PsTaAH-137]